MTALLVWRRLRFRFRACLPLAALCSAAWSAVSATALADPAEAITVVLDQAQVVRMPERVATIVIGNPLIADATVQPGGILVITGKGYGLTNLIALDRSGNVLMEQAVVVQGPSDSVVVVYRGINRESYSCTPLCERRVTLGDTPDFFEATLGQIGTRANRAQAGGAAPSGAGGGPPGPAR